MHQTSHYKIGIDCRLLGSKHAGIGRYIENLLLQIPYVELHKKFEFTFIFHDKEQWNEFLSQTDKEAFFKSQQVIFSPVRHYSLDEQLKMPQTFLKLDLDLLHIPHFNIPIRYPGRIVVTIHDLLWHEYRGSQVTTLPTWKYWLKHQVYKKVVAHAIKKAETVFVPAHTVKRTVTQYFPESIDKIVVTPEGIGQSFLRPQQSKTKKNKHLIYVGSLYPHKNIEVVLQALRALPDFALDLVGSRNVFQDQIRNRVSQLGLTNQVNFLGYVPDDELVKLFQTSFALVQPSLFEGFGLTGVEAMAAGLPVIASDIPVFHEIYQDRALFFTPSKADHFVEKIHMLKDNEVLYKELSSFSKTVAIEFSWEKMTEQVLTEYLKVCQL